MTAPRGDGPQALRILLVMSRLAFEGGIGRVVAGQASALRARGHDVHVAGPVEGDPPVAVEGIALHPWPRRGQKILHVPALLRVVRHVRPDVVHLHAALAHGELVLALWLWRRGRTRPRLVVTSHSGSRAEHPKRRARLGLRLADAVLAPSDWSAAHARAAGVASERVHVVQAGVALPRLPPVERRPEILALGRLAHVKGYDLLIDAFAQVAPERPAWRLRIGGEGRLREELERRAASAGIAERVELPGHLVGDAKLEALARASIGAMSSRRESFGGALLELQAAGLACVAAGTAGLEELSDGGRAALTFPSEDAGALARTLARLMDDAALRASLGEAARSFAAGFTWERHAQRCEKLYRRALAAAGPD